MLWPDMPIDCVVSLGTGDVPRQPRAKAMSTYLETGTILIENACSVERPDEALANTLPMSGCHYYRCVGGSPSSYRVSCCHVLHVVATSRQDRPAWPSCAAFLRGHPA